MYLICTCCKIFRSSVSICAHDSSGHMALVAGWPVLCQTEVRQLSVVVLMTDR